MLLSPYTYEDARFYRVPAGMAVTAGVSFFSPAISERIQHMAAKKRNPQRKYIRSERTYSLDEITSLTMDDGARVVTSADGDIKRPVCAGIDVHKDILMAAVCRTDPQTLNAVFYVRQFRSTNSDIHSMAEWLKGYGVQDVCMEPRADIGFRFLTSWNRAA